MTSGTERLIDGLVDDLEPVTQAIHLRQAYAVVLAVWAAVLGLVLWSQQSPMGAASLFADGVYLTSFVGLMLGALGATLSALAAGRPGRDQLENASLGVSAGGLLVASGVCLAGLLGQGAVPSPPGLDAMCLQKGAWLSLLPAGVILSFLVRGWTTRPLRAALVGMLAAGALGAAIVHLSCDFLGAGHLLRGHMFVPLALALLGTYPAGVVLRRLRK